MQPVQCMDVAPRINVQRRKDNQRHWICIEVEPDRDIGWPLIYEIFYCTEFAMQKKNYIYVYILREIKYVYFLNSSPICLVVFVFSVFYV